MRSAISASPFFHTIRLISAVLVIGLAVVACGSSTISATHATFDAWGLPFASGTRVIIGQNGLHSDSFYGRVGADKSGYYNLINPDGNEAALDIIPVDSNGAILRYPLPVIPVASGKVLAVNTRCHFLLIDHGNGLWVGYQHVDTLVYPGQLVTRGTIIGYEAKPQNIEHCEYSDAYHVHFAFLQQNGSTGTYFPMQNTLLCGHKVVKLAGKQEVELDGLVSGIKIPFAIPQCPRANPYPAGSLQPFPLAGIGLSSNGDFSLSTLGPDGNIWFTLSQAIGRLEPNGSFKMFPDTNNAPYGPILVGPDADLWFTQDYSDTGIGHITPQGDLTQVVPNYTYDSGQYGNSNPNYHALAVGWDGNIWFSIGVGPDTIGWVSPDGSQTQVFSSGGGNYQDFAIIPTVQNGEKGYWAVDNTGKFYFLTPDGTFTFIQTIPCAAGDAFSIGPDGNLWCAPANGANEIYRIDPQGMSKHYALGQMQPYNLIWGPDGKLWFAANIEQSNHQGLQGVLDCIDMNGTLCRPITIFPSTSHAKALTAIVLDAQNNFWIESGAGFYRYSP